MKICLFTPTFLPQVGGTEFVTDALARQFLSMGHEPVVLAQGAPTALDVPYPVRWYRKPIAIRWFPERTSATLRRLHEEIGFDVFCVNYANPTGYGAIRLGKRLGVPTVVVSHGGDLYKESADRRQPHIWRRIEYTYRHAEALIAISPYIEHLIRQINPNPKRLELIPNGIDLADYERPGTRPASFTDTRPFCLCLGNLGPLKGFDDAITAYAKVRSRLDETAMVIVGDGKLETALKQQARKLGVADDVIFVGRRVGHEKRWFLQNCQYGVMPSIEEGHPIVGLEFLVSGKPLVCTTNAAFDGMYDDGVNAYRVPPRTPDQLAEAIVKMHNADRGAMGEHSRRRSDNYTWPAVAQRYLALFESLIAEHEQDAR